MTDAAETSLEQALRADRRPEARRLHDGRAPRTASSRSRWGRGSRPPASPPSRSASRISDPLADGPVIQRAGQVALEHGMTVAGCLEVAAAIAGRGRAGRPDDLHQPGPGLRPEASSRPRRRRPAWPASSCPTCRSRSPSRWPDGCGRRRSTPSSWWRRRPPSERLRSICEHSSGFVYCVTVTGITGARKELPPGMKELFGRCDEHTEASGRRGLRHLAPGAHEGAARQRGRGGGGQRDRRRDRPGRDPVALVKELLKACR